jgi:hypothetical protein
MSQSACFQDVFGLSRTDCDCYNAAMPTDAAISASGYYLDELPGLNLRKIFAAADCETDAWTLMSRAREEGVRRVKEETMRGVRAATVWKRPPVRSQIGDDSNSRGSVNLDKTFHGLSVVFAHSVGGSVTINRIGGDFKFTGNVDVNVYGVDDDTPIATRTITITTANKTNWTAITPIILSLETETEQNPWYFFVFTPSVGQQAVNSRIAVGCSCKMPGWDGNGGFDESSIGQNGEAWRQWSTARGTKGNDITDKRAWTSTNETQGLLLDVSFSCDPSTVLCSGEPDYANDPIQQSFAVASRYAAGVYLIDTLSVGAGVDRDALLGGEAVGKLRIQYEGRFGKIVGDYLVPVLSAAPTYEDPNTGVNTYSDCFTCNNSDQPSVRPILT